MSPLKGPARYGATPEAETAYQRAGQAWDARPGSARVQAFNWRLVAMGLLALCGCSSVFGLHEPARAGDGGIDDAIDGATDDGSDAMPADATMCFGAGEYTVCFDALPTGTATYTGTLNTTTAMACATNVHWTSISQPDSCFLTGTDVVLNDLAWLYQIKGDARALPTAQQAYRLAPGALTVSDTLGWILVQQGDTEGGLKLLEAANSQPDQATPGMKYRLAVALERAGHLKEAREALNQALASGTSFAEAKDAQALREKIGD